MNEIESLGGLCWRCGNGTSDALVIALDLGDRRVVLYGDCLDDLSALAIFCLGCGLTVFVRGQDWPCSRGDHAGCPAINTDPAIAESDGCPCRCHVQQLEAMARS